MGLARTLAAFLEEGTDARWARGLAATYGPLADARLLRPARIPSAARVVTIGGATLGGSGATPLAIAFAEALARRGERVVFVGHGYRAAVSEARLVPPDAQLAAVGDEALVASQRFAAEGLAVPVVIGPSRSAALAFAARLGRTLVVDGALQLRPGRAALSLLAVAADAPWGADAPPPAGDLRASKAALLRACDAVVAVGHASSPPLTHDRPVFSAVSRSDGAFLDGELLPWERLAGLRVGLLTALARPGRLRRALAARKIIPIVHGEAPDHGPVDGQASRRLDAAPPIDLWIATAKCALHWRGLWSGKVAVLHHEIAVPSGLLALLDARGGYTRPTERGLLDRILPRP